ncbi:MAG TPA: tripartite tricarboxylate transporter permease [Methanomassiliicoccales archaeon]|jgi:TctA family transporter
MGWITGKGIRTHVVDPGLLLMVLYCTCAGAALGTLTGIAPGIHVNTLALIMLVSYPGIAGFTGLICGIFGIGVDHVPLLVCCMIVSASVVHSFVDFIPSVFLGAPDQETVLSILPGHRLLLSGKGLEAIACAAKGSLAGASVAVILVYPLFILMSGPIDLYGRFEPLIPGVLVVVMVMLVMAEQDDRRITTSIDARHGSVRRLERISVPHLVPRDGEPVTAWGRLERTSRKRFMLHSSQGKWTVLARAGTVAGTAEVSGVWRVRRNRCRKKISALLLLLSSGLLGFLALNARLPMTGLWDGIDGNMLFPLLTGLFGLPTLLSSISSGRIPEQEASVSHDLETRAAIGGALAGGFVGWVPGVTSTTGTMIGSMADPDRDGDDERPARRFITMVSSVGTAAAVFGIVALAVTGKGRTGALLVVKQMLGAEGVTALSSATSAETIMLLVSVLASALVGYLITIRLGNIFAARIGSIDLHRLTQAIIISLIILVFLMSGIPGLFLLLASTLLGLIPPRIGTNRVHLTGCLLFPITLFFFGMESPFAAFLGGLL